MLEFDPSSDKTDFVTHIEFDLHQHILKYFADRSHGSRNTG